MTLPPNYWQNAQRDYDTADPVELATMGRIQIGWRLGTVDSGHDKPNPQKPLQIIQNSL